MDKLFAYVDGVVSVNRADLVEGYDVRTVHTHEIIWWKDVLNSFHCKVGDERTLLILHIEHHIVLES